ncbi:PPE domain-containing protein [Nocardia sp. NPDC059091]|uniref:PPE domain-containing protein n=1 Tax=unclassified Nocardia TaxID=2637762 RepID=UPI0036AAA989
MWPLFYASFAHLPPEENARRVLSAPGPEFLGFSSDAYTVLATALYAAASASYADTDATRVHWTGPAGDVAYQALSQFSGWLHGQAENATRSAKVIAEVQAAATAAKAAMVEVMAIYVPLAAKTAVDVGLSIAHPAAGLPLVADDEKNYLLLQAEAAAVMNAYATAAGLALNTLPVSTAPPLIAKSPTAIMEGGVSPIGSGDPLGLPGTAGGRVHRGGTSPVGTGGGPVSGPGGSSPVSGQPSGGQPVGGQPGGGQPVGGQPGGGQPVDGQPSGGQPIGGQPSGGEPGSGLPDPQQPSSEWQAPDTRSDSLPNFGDGTAGLDDQGLYGVSPYSPTLAGLLGVGPGSTVTPAMTAGSVVSPQLRVPTAWRPATTQTFGAGTGSPAPQPISPRQPPRGASAPEAQRRRDRKDERKRSTTFVAGDGIEAPAADLPYLIEYETADTEPISESEKVLALGLLDQDLHSTTE